MAKGRPKRNSFAYGVFVAGRKRFGGVLHAASMEDAAVKAARACKVTRKCTGEPPYEQWNFKLDGKRASICVWARPEDDMFSVLDEQPRKQGA